MNEWIPKNNKIRFSIIIAFLSMVFYFGILFFLSREANRLKSFYQSAESESVKGKKFLAIKEFSEKNSEYLQTLDNFFVKKDDEIKFIKQVESAAKDSGIIFEIISVDDLKDNQPDKFKGNVKIKISMEGSWPKIMLFLDKLGKMPFGVSIENINLDAKGSDTWFGFADIMIFREE